MGMYLYPQSCFTSEFIIFLRGCTFVHPISCITDSVLNQVSRQYFTSLQGAAAAVWWLTPDNISPNRRGIIDRAMHWIINQQACRRADPLANPSVLLWSLTLASVISERSIRPALQYSISGFHPSILFSSRQIAQIHPSARRSHGTVSIWSHHMWFCGYVEDSCG